MKRIIAILTLVFVLVLPFTDALTITNIHTTDITDRTAVIRWDTDEPADSTVTYGADKANPQSIATDSRLRKKHTVPITNLDKKTNYFFKLRSTTDKTFAEFDNDGNFYQFSTASQDTFPPRIDFTLPEFTNQRRIDLIGETEFGTSLNLFNNNQLIRTYQSTNGQIEFFEVSLNNGINSLRIEATDRAGNKNSKNITITSDLTAPKITLTKPIPQTKATADLSITGLVSESAQIKITLNEEEVFSQETVSFDIATGLDEGSNLIIITATDAAGNTDEVRHSVSIDTLPPEIDEVEPLDDAPFYYEGRATDDVKGKTEPGAELFLFVSRGTAGFGLSPGGLSAGFGSDSVTGQPTLDDIKDRAQYTTVADAAGNFEFEDVNFEHPGFGLTETVPKEVQAGTESLVGIQFISDLQQDERTVEVWIAAVDKAGLSTVRQFPLSIGTCFSGFFDFNIQPLTEFQTPSILSPQRLDSGTETISFVLNVDYKGQAQNNRDNPNADSDENSFAIHDVVIEPACRDNAFLDRNPSYQYACQILQNRPDISRAINPERTNWYFRYNLGATDKFTDFKEEFWESLINNELRFPLRVSIDYDENIPGRVSQPKVQTICRDVSYFVDIPIDPREVLPDFLLEEGQKISQSTIELIDNVLPTLESIIQYAGVGCMGSFGLRTITQIYRRFIEKTEFAKCQALSLAGIDSCPIQDAKQLNQCFFLKTNDGKVPYPDTPEARSTKTEFACAAINDEFYNQDTKRDLEESPIMMKHFPATVGAWKTEARLYQAYRWLCDRVFCHAAPAGWTQEIEVSEIRQHLFEQQQCATDTSSARTLLPIDNCWEILAEKQKLKLVITREDLIKGNGQCYELQGAIYYVTDESGASNEADLLRRVDIARSIRSTNAKVEKPFEIWAVKIDSTYYTADTRSCPDVCGKDWENQCETPENSVGWYPAGPTADCWINSNGFSQDKQCFCRPHETPESESREKHEKIAGSKYAGTETGVSRQRNELGIELDRVEEESWPWSYREWQIQRSTKNAAGILYPKERYYSGRDKSAAFGADYLLDYINPPPKTTEVNPFTQHIGAFQSVCLTGIRGRLLLLRNILNGFQNCLSQVQTTGRADAGVCKEIFSQYVCNLSYKALTYFQDQCVPEPFSPLLKKEGGVDGIQDFLKHGTSAITETMESTASELSEEYGNAKVNQYFEGGTQALSKRICLAAFGIESGFDFNNFLDAAYSVPFKTSASIFSSEGAVGRREFLSFDPTTLNSVYEYRAAWTIFPGCDLESYRIDLAQVTQNEARLHPNIECSAVNNFEPQSNGCDNWHAQAERTTPFFSGGRVTQNVYVDQNAATTLDNPYRYDHFKITLSLNPQWEADKCFPKENVVSKNTAVFYYPIHDATSKDIQQCSVLTTDGRFVCTISDLSDLGQSWIESVRCLNPRSADYQRCDRLTLSVEDEEPVAARATVFSTGQNKMCLAFSVETENAGSFPAGKTFVEIPGLGRPSSVPVDLEIIPEITEEHFRGFAGEGIRFVPQNPPTATCSQAVFDSNQDAQPANKISDRAFFTFDKADHASKILYTVTLPRNTEVLTNGYSPKNGKLSKDDKTDGDKTELTEQEIQAVSYRVNGYFIKNVFGKPDGERGTCRYDTVVDPSQAQPEQTWNVNFKLFYPDNNNQCSDASQPVPQQRGLAFEVDSSNPIKVRATKATTLRQTAYEQGKKFYTDKNYIQALNQFETVQSTPPTEGDRIEFLSYWWSVASEAHLMEEANAQKSQEHKDNIISLATRFASRLDGAQALRNSELLDTSETQLIIAYIGEIEKRLTTGTKMPPPRKATNFDCDECAQIDEAWFRVRSALNLRNEYFNPRNGNWEDKSKSLET